MTLRKGSAAASVSPGVGQLSSLSESQKYSMSIDLLNEFGAQNLRENDDELIHSCLLPFGMHTNGDAKPSASLNWRKLTYNCFGCGNGGSLLWFVSLCRGEDIGQVRQWADSKTGLEVDSEESLACLLTYLDSLYNPAIASQAPPIPHFNPAVLEPWRLIHPYLTEIRHIPVDNLVKHDVGYDDKLNRIVFPLWWEGDLVGWQTRRIVNDGTAKYLNTPDFPRDRVVYNGSVQCKSLVLVESPMTVIAKSHLAPEYGFVATFGARVTAKQLQVITDLSVGRNTPLILWYDNDNAGWEATRNVAEDVLRYCDVLVVDSPWNEDAAGLDDQTTLELLQRAIPYSSWTPPAEIKEWQR